MINTNEFFEKIQSNQKAIEQWEYTDISGNKWLGNQFIYMAHIVWNCYPDNVIQMIPLNSKQLKVVGKQLGKTHTSVQAYAEAFVSLGFRRWLHIPTLRRQVSMLRETYIASHK